MDSPAPPTFDNFDLLSLKPFAAKLEGFLMVEHDYVEGSLVVALDGSFGSGKSTFLDMWKNDLINREGEELPFPVVLNAWESDHCGDPMLAILAGLLDAIEEYRGPWAKKNAKLGEVIREFGGVLGAAASTVAGIFVKLPVKIDAEKIVEKAEKEAKGEPPAHEDVLSAYRKRTKALKEIKRSLAEELGGADEPPRILVMVDELDRCRPDYAVQYLETIKHVFDVRGMVFVLAIDLQHLENSVKTLYGGGLNTAEYFRKFWHRTVPIPKPDSLTRGSLAMGFLERYFSIEGKRMTALGFDEDFFGKLVICAAALSLTPRQVKEAFRLMGFTFQTSDPKKIGHLAGPVIVGVGLLCFIRVARPISFYEFLSQPDGFGEPILVELLKEMNRDEKLPWIILVISGCLMPTAPDGIDRFLLANDGPEISTRRKAIREMAQAWGYRSRSLWLIAKQIEEAGEFEWDDIPGIK